MNKFSIKSFCKGKDRLKLSAFTVAEMLLVLLIVSFLIIAIPPLVNKKIAKQVVRGEHGRYECWINPDNGRTYEYLATERHGIGDLFHIGDQLGRELPAGERCRFKPAEMAPTAPYFVMQIIGGGAGGAYAPYDASNTNHRLDNFTQHAWVRSFKERNNTDFSGWQSAYGYLHTGSDFFNLIAKYAHERPNNNSSYVDPWLADGSWYKQSGSGVSPERSCGGTLYYANSCPDRKWAYDYFPPVVSQAPLKVCSGHGLRGASRTTISSNYTDPVYQTDASGNYVLDENGNKILVTPGQMYVGVEYGGRGGYGHCMEAPAGSLALGRDGDSSIFVKTDAPYNSYDYAAYFTTNGREPTPSYNWFSYAKYNYHYDGENATGNIVQGSGYSDNGYPITITSNYSDAIENIVVAACPYTTGGTSYNVSATASLTPNNNIALGKSDVVKNCKPALTAYTHNVNGYKYLERPYFDSNNRVLHFANGDNVRIINDLPMGITITAQTYNNGELQPANCKIPGGSKGYDVKLNNEDPDPDKSIPASVEEGDITECELSVWQSAGVNDSSTYGGRKYTIPMSGANGRSGLFSDDTSRVFPFEIRMKRVVNLDANTYGYAGRPGESIGMYIPRLTGTLEFDIGMGGSAGEFGDVESRRGKPGTRTIVWRKREGAPDSMECAFNSNGAVNHSECSSVAIANGGLGYRNGAIGKKIVVRGELTCNTKDDDDNWVVNIDGCLDAGAGPYASGAAGNSLRFAENSNFYTIPELDAESTTRSAIEQAFENRNLPGSGGDGGYSFLKQLNGAETVTAQYHTNFTPESMAAIGAGSWQTTGNPYELTSNRDNVSQEDLQFSGYKCYRKGDNLNAPRDIPTGIPPLRRTEPEVVSEPGYERTAFCKPENGMPGAVVIVW